MAEEKQNESLYSKLLKKGKEAVEAMQIPFKVRKAQKDLEMKIIEIEQEIATAELTIEEQQSQHPIDWTKLIDAIDSKELKGRKLKQLKELEGKLF